MALITDIIDPATLTGYVRAAVSDTLAQQKTLAVFLPFVQVEDIVVEFIAGQAGLVDAANFRAWDAAPDGGAPEGGEEVLLKLAALGRWEPVREYDQLRARNANVSDERVRDLIKAAAKRCVLAVYERLEATMGTAIDTGKVVEKTGKFALNENFGRAGGLTVTNAPLWSAEGTDVLSAIEGHAQTYAAQNGGVRPEVLRVSSQALLSLAKNPAFATSLAGGGSRPATQAQVNEVLVGSNLPSVFVYDRKVRVNGVVRDVLPADRVHFLPAAGPVESDTPSALGATYLGVSLSATKENWRIPEVERPGVVAGAYDAEVPPHITQVYSDAVGMPVLANANASMAVKVL